MSSVQFITNPSEFKKIVGTLSTVVPLGIGVDAESLQPLAVGTCCDDTIKARVKSGLITLQDGRNLAGLYLVKPGTTAWLKMQTPGDTWAVAFNFVVPAGQIGDCKINVALECKTKSPNAEPPLSFACNELFCGIIAKDGAALSSISISSSPGFPTRIGQCDVYLKLVVLYDQLRKVYETGDGKGVYMRPMMSFSNRDAWEAGMGTVSPPSQVIFGVDADFKPLSGANPAPFVQSNHSVSGGVNCPPVAAFNIKAHYRVNLPAGEGKFVFPARPVGAALTVARAPGHVDPPRFSVAAVWNSGPTDFMDIDAADQFFIDLAWCVDSKAAVFLSYIIIRASRMDVAVTNCVSHQSAAGP